MARRQQPTPQTEYAVLEDRIAKLEAQVRTLSGTSRSVILTSDKDKHLDPVQGEIILNHPGVHVPAGPDDPVVYYHNSVDNPGWKKMVGGALPWIQAYSGAGTIPTATWQPICFRELVFDPNLVDPNGSVTGDIFRWYTTAESDPDSQNTRWVIGCHAPGIYLIGCQSQWDQVGTAGTEEYGTATMDVRGAGISYDGSLPMAGFETYWRVSSDWPRLDVEGQFEFAAQGGFLEMNRTFIKGDNENVTTYFLEPWGYQDTGVDRGLSGVFMYAVYLGATSDTGTWEYRDSHDYV